MQDGRIRLHKFIADCGITSRRKAEELIREGRVEVNGATVTDMGVKVSAEDRVIVDGRPLKLPKLHYVLMNKPKGYLTTLSDPHKRPTVAKLLPDLGVALKPVGRLDMETEGLLIFTNDGEFALRLTHPSFGIEKEYEAVVSGQVTPKAIKNLTQGVYIDGRRTAPAKVVIRNFNSKSNQTTLRIAIHEGRNRQVRLMCEYVGHPVSALKRIRIGHLVLREMPPGMCKSLGLADVQRLLEAAGGGGPLAKEKKDSRGPRKSPQN